jgi:hypothetical protein
MVVPHGVAMATGPTRKTFVRTGGVGDRSLRTAITRHEVGAEATLARRRERARGRLLPANASTSAAG